ncbi:uncharacterized protein PG998_007708 [Apiospora kogelbergensis]|uniref:uncharacterized protein n=1 Tax=Apiospora kogelbergensis TaxID=1337665 RepID=UPI00312E69C4
MTGQGPRKRNQARPRMTLRPRHAGQAQSAAPSAAIAVRECRTPGAGLRRWGKGGREEALAVWSALATMFRRLLLLSYLIHLPIPPARRSGYAFHERVGFLGPAKTNAKHGGGNHVYYLSQDTYI